MKSQWIYICIYSCAVCVCVCVCGGGGGSCDPQDPPPPLDPAMLIAMENLLTLSACAEGYSTQLVCH